MRRGKSFPAWAISGAAKNAIAQTHESFPELRLMQTENECGNGENSWKYMEYVFDLMHHYFKNGVEAYTYWNMVLEDGGCSTWGWHQNSMITVNAAEGTYALEPEYYLMRHFAGFVQRGARLLKLRGRFAANAMAFENPDGSVVLVVHNGQNDRYAPAAAWARVHRDACAALHQYLCALKPGKNAIKRRRTGGAGALPSPRVPLTVRWQ